MRYGCSSLCLFQFSVLLITCCEVFFFFCKQKTSYEVRISDWSSDVCSSDLSTISPSVLMGRRNRRSRCSAPAAFAAKKRRRSSNPEIGRASCRERVCQYV